MIRLVHRSLLVLRGADATPLMQGLITNDVRILEAGKLVAAFLLNIKGRIVEDLILWQRNQDLLIECSTKTRDDLKKTLEKYRMRKKVDIVASDEPVCFSTENGDFQDPRLSSLGFRSFGKDGNENVGLYHQKRRELGIAEGSEEIAGLLPFQCNGDLLNMISLDKGCYIGQELTARTAHTGVIRKRILPFKYDGNGELEKIVTDKNKKKAGEVFMKHSFDKMGQGESSMALDKHLFELKFAAKQLERSAANSEKQEKVEKDKLTQAIKKGNVEVAKIHAENAIRKKNEAVNYIRMAARIDAVAARVQSAATQRRVTQSMAGVVKAMESAMKSMNLEKVQQLMDRFERDFENLDVHTATMERTMDGTTVLNAPQQQVDQLIAEAADKAGIELGAELPSSVPTALPSSSASVVEDKDLTERLAALRNM